MNIPYVKEYNKNGEVINPIRGIYTSPFPNRRTRRAITKLPNSTKIAKSSRSSSKILRRNKFKPQINESRFVRRIKRLLKQPE